MRQRRIELLLPASTFRSLRSRFLWLITLSLPAALSATLSARQPETDSAPVVTSSAERISPGWLTTDGALKRDPAFWPGTSYLVYAVEDERTGAMHLQRIDVRTGAIAPLLPDDPVSTREFSASRDGKVYAYNRVSGLSSTLHVNDDRSGRTVTLPRMGKASWANWACVSPNGDHVLFVEGASSIYVFELSRDPAKTNVRALSHNAEHQSDYWPRYSPSGENIVFVSNRDGDFEIYSMRANGSDVRRLTHSPGIEMHPSYSPDGSRIAFTSNRDGDYEIYVMDESLRPKRITQNPERDDYPIWSPDGQQLVFVSEHDGKFDLRVVDVDER